MKIRPLLILSLILVIFLGTAGIHGGSKTLAGSFDSFTLPADKPLFQILEPTGEKPIKGFPVLRLAQPSSPVVQNAAEFLTNSFAAQALKLHWYAKDYLIRQLSENGQIGLIGLRAGQKRVWLDQPTYMGTGMVGGWALDGFWLREGSRHRSFATGLTLFDQFRAIPVTYLFDLNAASIVDLRTIPGVDLKLARTILKQRNERGYFRSIEGLSTVPGVNNKLLDSLREMNSAMNEVILGRKAHPLKTMETLSSFPFLPIFFPYLKAALLKVLVLVAGGWAVFKLMGRLIARLWNVQIRVAPARNAPVPRESNRGRRVRMALSWLLKGIGLLALLLIAILTVVLVPPLSSTARMMVALVLTLICWLGLAVKRREAAPLSSFASPASLGLMLSLAAVWAFMWVLV